MSAGQGFSGMSEFGGSSSFLLLLGRCLSWEVFLRKNCRAACSTGAVLVDRCPQVILQTGLLQFVAENLPVPESCRDEDGQGPASL